jgi:hypothetical protein
MCPTTREPLVLQSCFVVEVEVVEQQVVEFRLALGGELTPKTLAILDSNILNFHAFAAGPVRQSCASPTTKRRICADEHGHKRAARNPGRIEGLRAISPTGAEGLEPPTYGFGDRRSTN